MGVQMAEKKKRRQFTKEFRAEAVQLVRESGKAVSVVALGYRCDGDVALCLGEAGQDRPW